MDEKDIARWEELLEAVEVIRSDIKRELDKAIFPLGREEAARRLEEKIHNMTFIGMDKKPVSWWKPLVFVEAEVKWELMVHDP